MPHRIISTDADYDRLGRLLAGMKRPFTIQYSQGRNRSLDQNALVWMWAGEVAAQLGDRTADEVQRAWKLAHGVPILRSENEAFRSVYESAFARLPYEAQLEAMRFLPVTREMTVPQMVRFIDAIERESAEMGLVLTQPVPEMVAYHARYRKDVT